MNGPTVLSAHLRKPVLAETLARARELLSLERHLRAALGDVELAAHCRLANVHDSILVLEADSPAWATRLRYATPSLLRTLSGFPFPPVQEVKIRVRPVTAAREPQRRAKLSLATAEHLRQAAAALPDDALADALRRLANRAASADR